MTEIIEKIKQRIVADIDLLDQEEERVQLNENNIEITKEEMFWDGLGRDPIDFLRTNIASLIRYKKNVTLSEQRFVFNCEQYILTKLELDAIPDWWKQPIAITQRNMITEDIAKLSLNVPDIAVKEDLIKAARNSDFWDDTNIEDILKIIDELGPLMKHKSSEPQRIIEIKADDQIEERGAIIYGPDTDRREEHVEVYQQKVERRVRELAETHPVLQKIKENKELSRADLESLEAALNAPELYITEETLKRTYQNPGEMVQFMRHILDIAKLKDPIERIDEAFRGFEINHTPPFSADQLHFLRILQTVFERKKHIEKGDLYELPFKNLGNTAPTPMFKEETVDEMVNMCKKLEEVFV